MQRAPVVLVTGARQVGKTTLVTKVASEFEATLNHPTVGASWEGFAIEQIATMLEPNPVYFWGTQSGAEVDLFTVASGGRRIGFEFKRSDAPKTTRSMHTALDELELDALHVVYPGPDRYQLTDKVHATPLNQILTSTSNW